MSWQQILTWAAAVGAAVAAIKNLATIVKWLGSPFRWTRGVLGAKRENARLQLEGEHLITENNALIAENLALQTRNAELIQLLDDRERWVSHTTKGGGVVLRDEEATDPAAHPIYRCINCAHEGKRTFLQPKSANRFLHCPTHGDINYEWDGIVRIGSDALSGAGRGSADRREYDPYGRA